MAFKYKHIIWDWNGTIIDDALFCLKIINSVLKKRGISEITHRTYLDHFDFPIKDFYEKIGFDFSREPFQKPADEYIEKYDKDSINCSLHEGIVDIISEIKGHGIEQSILSASKEASLRKMVDHFSLAHFFKNISGLNDHYANGKIDTGIDLIKKINIPKQDIVMIGDTSHDYEVACTLGIDSILVNGGHQNKARLEACGVPVLDSITELRGML